MRPRVGLRRQRTCGPRRCWSERGTGVHVRGSSRMAAPFRLDHTTFVAMLRERDWRDTSDIRQLADWLDSRFEIPGTKFRFGLDSIIGLVPGVGDLITTLLGGYIIVRAAELGAPKLLIARMMGNLAIDSIVGDRKSTRLNSSHS